MVLKKLLTFLVSGFMVFAAGNPIDISDLNADAFLYLNTKESITTSEAFVSVYEKSTPDKQVGTATNFPVLLENLNVKDGSTYILKDGAKKSINLIVDDKNPTVEITGIEEGKTYKHASGEITITDKNLDSEKVMLDDKEIVRSKDSYVINLKPNSTEIENHKLEISAKDKAKNSINKTISFKVYDDAPIITVSGLDKDIQNKNYTIKANIESKLTYESKIKLTKDGKEIDAGNILSGVTLEDEGIYNLSIEATDEIGNVSKYNKTFEIDKTAPKVDVSEIPSFTNKDVLIDVKTEAGTENTFKLNDKNTESKVSLSEEGSYKFYYKSVDKAGNITEGTINFTIDKTVPKIEISDIPKFTNKDLIVSIKAESSSETEVILDGNKLSGTSNFNFTVKEEGTHTLSYKSTDKAGNITADTIEFTIDKTAPEVKISDFSTYEKNDFKITINAETGTSGTVTYDGVQASGNVNYTIQAKGEGKHNISYSFVDSAGNTSKDSIDFIIDKTAPTVEFTDIDFVKSLNQVVATGNDAFGEVSYIEISAKTDDKDVPVEKVFGSKANIKDNSTDEVKNEKWTITATVFDKAGNSTTLSKDVTKDNCAPDISLRGATTGLIINKDVEVTAKFEDANISVRKLEILKNGESIKTLTGSDELSFIARDEGVYTFYATAKDKSGNTSSEIVDAVEIDKTAPIVKLTAPSGNHKSVSEVSAKSNEKGKTYLVIKRDGKVIEKVDDSGDFISYSKLNKDGNYSITAYSIDRAGNKSSSVTKDFIIDSVAPKVSLSGAKDGEFYNKTLTIKATVDELNYSTNKVYFTGSHNGKSFNIPFKNNGKVSINTKALGSDGKYTITLKAVDKAGNASAIKSLSFTVDKKKPVIKIEGPSVINKTGTGAPKITITDENFKSKDINISRKITAISCKDSFGEKGGTRTYRTFAKLKENDGIYTLSVRAVDKAGNIETATKNFTINRFGSKFKFLNKPKRKNQKITKDLVLKEENLSGIESYKVFISRDTEQTETNDVRLSHEGTSNVYKIGKGNFSEDGVYKIYIKSRDNAGNSSIGGNKYSFTVDQTAPVITYKGVEANKAYKEDQIKIYVKASDTLSDVKNITVTVNNIPAEMDTDDVGTYAIINSGYRQKINIIATDSVGNKGNVELKNVSVSTSPFAFLFTHTKIVAGIIALIIAIATIIMIGVKKAHSKSENDVDDADMIL